MIELVQQIMEFYLKKQEIPKVDDLKIKNKELLKEKGSLFVTIYQNWEIRGSAWNIKELKENIIEELIENTISAISKDKRFKPLTLKDNIKKIKIRVDKIWKRELLNNKSIKIINPVKSGVIAIKNDYTKLWAILPNIDTKLINWEDFIQILKEKMWEKNFSENDYIIYEIETEVETNF